MINPIAELDMKKFQTETVEKQNKISETKELLDTKVKDSTDKPDKTLSERLSDMFQVKLANHMFGFNRESRDFYVKVERGEHNINQYPTDEMMKLKAFYLSQQDIGI